MPRRLTTLAAMSALALTLALGASPAMAAGSPLTHWSVPADALGSLCGYHFVSGDLTDTYRTADVTIDPVTGEPYIPAAHMTLHGVLAERDGALYKVVGGETYSDPNGRLTAKLMFISQGGGIVDSVNIVFRVSPNGDVLVYHDLGTCSFA